MKKNMMTGAAFSPLPVRVSAAASYDRRSTHLARAAAAPAGAHLVARDRVRGH